MLDLLLRLAGPSYQRVGVALAKRLTR